MTREQVSRWARRYVVASASFLVLWQTVLLAGVSRRTSVTLGLFGFVFHMVFGKAYSLVPTYFDRELAVGWVPGVQFPLTTLGTMGLAIAGLDSVPADTALGTASAGLWTVSAGLWTAGVVVFLGSLVVTLRGNLRGRDTATGAANADRRPVDRLANGFVPVALGYLALGSYATLAPHSPVPVLVDGYAPRASHLLGAGSATLLVFALGARLLPRFMVAHPPRWLVGVALSAGALAPLLLASALPAGPVFIAGAVLEATAVLAYALTIAVLVRRSDRRRVGFYAVAAGATAGVLGVLLGLFFALANQSGRLVAAHYRLTLLGLLGLTVVGVAFQFYPPNAAPGRLGTDRTALGVISALTGGLALQVLGLATARGAVSRVGVLLALVGAVGYWTLLVALFRAR